MDALSTEWRFGIHYATGNRVAFKITGSLGVAAFECLQARMSSFLPPLFLKYLFLLTPYRSVDISALDNQVSDFGIFRRLRSLKITFVKPTAGGNAYWKHYPRGFPWS